MAKSKKDSLGLTTRQWRTHDLIERNSAFGLKTTIEEIVANYPYPQFKDGYVLNTNPRTHHPCVTVYSDIDEINANLNVHIVILWNDDHEYWVAENEKEVEEFTNHLYRKQALRKLWKKGMMMYKAKRNGQMRLSFDDKSKQREYWRSFLTTDVEGMVEELLDINDDE